MSPLPSPHEKRTEGEPYFGGPLREGEGVDEAEVEQALEEMLAQVGMKTEEATEPEVEVAGTAVPALPPPCPQSNPLSLTTNGLSVKITFCGGGEADLDGAADDNENKVKNTSGPPPNPATHTTEPLIKPNAPSNKPDAIHNPNNQKLPRNQKLSPPSPPLYPPNIIRLNSSSGQTRLSYIQTR
jgi:hypothetical protein